MGKDYVKLMDYTGFLCISLDNFSSMKKMSARQDRLVSNREKSALILTFS